MASQILLPNDWDCMDHQVDLYNAISEEGIRRALCIWHRRGGKDSTALNLTNVMAHERVGTYWHLLPQANQARKVVWEGIDREGRRIIDQVFPEQIRDKTNGTEMFIRLKCGSVWQLAGSDNYNSLVGSNPVGVVFSEWALCDPQAWDYIRPILAENGGWAIFIYTPRGKNHGYTLYERVKKLNSWYVSKLNVEDTHRADGTPIVSQEAIQEERDSGMSEEMIQQEFYCSFAAGVTGAYYAKNIEKARQEGRIGHVPYDRRLPVHTYWDIGIDDKTAVWFGQREGYSRRWFRYEEWKDTALLDIYDEIENYPYRFAFHHFPHDAGSRNPETGRERLAFAEDIFTADVLEVPRHDVADGIEATRYLIDQSRFDENGCKHGLDALENYRKIWDEERRIYLLKPLHDWASDGADAFRQAAVMDIDEPVIPGHHETVPRVRVYKGAA